MSSNNLGDIELDIIDKNVPDGPQTPTATRNKLEPSLILAANESNWQSIEQQLEQLSWDTSILSDLFVVLSSLQRLDFFEFVSRIELDVSVLAKIFIMLRPSEQGVVLDALPIEKASSIFMQVDNRNRLEIVSHLHQSAFQKLVSVLSREELHVAEYWRSFPEGTVGRIMDPLSQYCVLSGNLTAKEATSAIVEKDFTTESVYVIDDEGNLLGAIPLVKFAALVVQDLQESLESQEITLSELALQEPQLYTVKTSVLIVEFARDLNRRPVNANGFVVPVVDENGLLKGFVTAHDALQATTKEWVSIAQKTASMEGIQVTYSKARVSLLVSKRAVWLLVLVIANFGSSGVIASFEHVLEQFIGLSYFLPLLIDMGGNTGSQSATLLITALATKDISLADFMKVLWKEVRVGIFLAILLAICTFGMATLMTDSSIGLIVCFTMICIITLSNILGTCLPFLATKLGLDPTILCGPLVTTLIDVSGISIYFGIATMFINAGHITPDN